MPCFFEKGILQAFNCYVHKILLEIYDDGAREVSQSYKAEERTPAKEHFTAANVPTLKVSADNYVHVPEGWLEGSDDSESSDVEP